MNGCKYGKPNCKNDNDSCRDICDICFDGLRYTPAKEKKKTCLKKHSDIDHRTGARFEQKNHRQNQKHIDVVSNRTPNSGAGKIKGDEQITGIINIMEELKTKTAKQTRGAETFTIHKSWLTKLTEEAGIENKEFWYLKFSFFEDDDDVYVIVPSDIIMSMVSTMIADRKISKNAQKRIDLANARADRAEKESEYLRARIIELKKEGDCRDD